MRQIKAEFSIKDSKDQASSPAILPTQGRTERGQGGSMPRAPNHWVTPK